MGFQKVIYENSEEKNIHFRADISMYTGHRHFEMLCEVFPWTYCKGLSLKNSHYAYIPPHMHKTLPTLENEKEQ